MGSDHVEWAALAVNKTVDVHLKLRGIMGVAIPMITATGEPPKLLYSPAILLPFWMKQVPRSATCCCACLSLPCSPLLCGGWRTNYAKLNVA